MSAVRRSARIGCSKVGAEPIEDDVAQEVFMLFLDKMLDKFDADYNVEPLLIETSRRVALSLMRKNREMSIEDTESLPEAIINDINTHNGLEANPVSFLDQQKALQAIKMKFPGAVSEARKKDMIPPEGVVKKRERVQRTLSKTCARLREIRLELGKSQEEFAAMLGIPTATLLSYEYGRTPNVPENIMESAESIYKVEHTVAKRNKAQAERPMREIVNEWAELLGVDPNDFKTIAEIVGVAKSTVHRWVDEEMRPRPRELNGYIRAVKLVAKRLKSGTKAIAEIY